MSWQYWGRIIGYVGRPLIRLQVNNSRRVRALIVCGNETLLVRHPYMRQILELPGGAIKRSENAAQALSRELMEELSLDVSAAASNRLLFRSKHTIEELPATYWAEVYILRFKSKPRVTIRRREILEARWCDINNLGEPVDNLVQRALSTCGQIKRVA